MNEEKIWIADIGDFKVQNPTVYSYSNDVEKRIEKLENQINKIIEFLNKFLDTNIKT